MKNFVKIAGTVLLAVVILLVVTRQRAVSKEVIIKVKASKTASFAELPVSYSDVV